MARKQVFKVAKELGYSAGEFLDQLNELGIEKSGNFAVLEDEEYELVMDLFNGDEATDQAEPAQETSQQQAAGEAKPVTDAGSGSNGAGTATATAPASETDATEVDDPEATDAPAQAEEAHGEPRAPIVAVLGHVDHGKTTVLDQIRKTHVVEGEAGGITQSIGAYQIEHDGQAITFVDTPGHRAFTGMRARGAQVTDIVVLVVAADDGIMEQTREAINHARQAGVPMIVAINKIDKPNADVSRVMQDLAQENLLPEDYGGDTITVQMAALKGEGIDELLEMIALVAEMEGLRADPNGELEGVIIESYIDPNRGPLSTAIVKEGTLRERDILVAGAAQGRVKALLDDHGQRLKEAGPGMPAQIMGLSDAPQVGIGLERVKKSSKAKKIVEQREEEARRQRLQRTERTWDDILAEAARQQGKVSLIVKADTIGGLEAVEGEIARQEIDEVDLEIIHKGVGNISESDVLLAASSEEDVSIVGFQVDIDKKARDKAEDEGITARNYDIIYELADDVRKALRGLMEPEYKEVKLGEAEVRDTFGIPKVGTVAGCFVRDGRVTRHAHARVMRDGRRIHEGPIANLKRFQQDAREVGKDKECGIRIEGFDDVEVGDTLEIFALEEVERL